MLENFSKCLAGQVFNDWNQVLHTTSAHIARKPRDEEEDDDEDDDENDKTPPDNDDDDDNDDEGYSE